MTGMATIFEELVAAAEGCRELQEEAETLNFVRAFLGKTKNASSFLISPKPLMTDRGRVVCCYETWALP